MNAKSINDSLNDNYAVVVKYINGKHTTVTRSEIIDESTIFANENQFINLNNVTNAIVCKDERQASNAAR
ncbi:MULTISPECIES: hypothetical protein [Staphylococcus]|uniref:hypothetical protein n=1 Tax=Bacilli TaxID=91061 RepID=UPI00049A1E7B|nr:MULTISPECIES: hypothetical protein [Staphylococcus]MDN6267790.1 hypothetical protein [Tetragenococcus koreensis]AID03005.1 hypothetical protein BE24_05510 [Staphylococcus xylosus]AYX89316.1 hypothetical protein EGX68_03350 [Staphylococcus cohnii]MEB7851280.1 hypothetical protein [Staphylococcus equorum]PNZ44649.1 hypothetical protein CD032_06675 [Staphylococcus cohnii subsp. cohnii]